MITYLVVAGIGLAFLLLSLVVRMLLDEVRIGRWWLSGPAIGNAAVVFGVVGVLAVVNDASTVVTNGAAAVAAVIAAGFTQLAVDRLAVQDVPPAQDDSPAQDAVSAQDVASAQDVPPTAGGSDGP